MDEFHLLLKEEQTAADIHRRKKLKKSEKILDHMGSEELGANLFRITQTEAKLRREQPQGLETASGIHYQVGQTVCEVIAKNEGTMPDTYSRKEHCRNWQGAA